jgi:hypothetical protein
VNVSASPVDSPGSDCTCWREDRVSERTAHLVAVGKLDEEGAVSIVPPYVNLLFSRIVRLSEGPIRPVAGFHGSSLGVGDGPVRR